MFAVSVLGYLGGSPKKPTEWPLTQVIHLLFSPDPKSVREDIGPESVSHAQMISALTERTAYCMNENMAIKWDIITPRTPIKRQTRQTNSKLKM